MDVFCLPSYANEGVPQALMQSQACGIPAITTLNGSINEAITPGESALIVNTHDSNAILIALERLNNDKDTLLAMSEAAHHYAVNHFSKEQMIERMCAIFESVIK